MHAEQPDATRKERHDGNGLSELIKQCSDFSLFAAAKQQQCIALWIFQVAIMILI